MPIALINFRDRIYRLREELSTIHLTYFDADLKSQLVMQYSLRVLTKLADIVEKNDTAEPEVISQLNIFLSENWEAVNGTPLAYTALPEHSVTDLLCDIAIFVAENAVEKTSAIHALMPTVCTESLLSEEEDLDRKALKKVIRTHVQGRTGEYLVPIALLTTFSHDTDMTRVANPYFSIEKHSEESAYLSEGELERLEYHHPDTQSFFDIKREYDLLVKSDRDSLLNQLYEMLRLMRYNASHGGIGTDKVAAKGGMIAIVNFFMYFEKLTDAQKSQIPSGVINELNELKGYAASKGIEKDSKGNPKLYKHKRIIHNPDGTKRKETFLAPKAITLNTSMGSCLATRNCDLQAAIKGHEAILSAISLSAEAKTTLVQEKIDAVKNAVKEMRLSLERQVYQHGFDKLEMTKAILDRMGVVFIPQVVDDLTVLYHLTPMEISEITDIEGTSEKIVTAFGSISDFVIFIANLSVERLEILLKKIKMPLIKGLITTSSDFSEALISLTIDKADVIYHVFEDQIPGFIKTADDFLNVLQNLSLDQCTAVCDSLKEQSFVPIKTIDDFWNMFQRLSIDQCTVIWHSFKDQLLTLDLVETVDNFAERLKLLSADHCSVACKVLEDQLSNVITTVDLFVHVLRPLTADRRKAFFDAFKDKLPTLIKKISDVVRVLLLLSVDDCAMLCNALKHQSPGIITTLDDLDYLLQRLSANQCLGVYDALKDQLQGLIKTADDFYRLLQYFFADQYAVVCSGIKDQLSSIINTVDDFEFLLKRFTSSDRRIAIQEHIERLAVQHFLAQECILNSPDWKINHHEITIAKIIQHATERDTGYSGQFFDRPRDNTTTLLKALGVCRHETDSRRMVFDSNAAITVALLKLSDKEPSPALVPMI